MWGTMIAESALVFTMACNGLTGSSGQACIKGTQAAAMQSGAAQYAEDLGKYIELQLPFDGTVRAITAASIRYSYDKSVSTEFDFKFLDSNRMYIDHKDNVKSIFGLKWVF